MLRAARAPLEPEVVLGAAELVPEAGLVADAVVPKPVFVVLDGSALVERRVTLAALPLPEAVLLADVDADEEVGGLLAPVTVVDRVADTAPMAKSELVEKTVLTSSIATNSIV